MRASKFPYLLVYRPSLVLLFIIASLMALILSDILNIQFDLSTAWGAPNLLLIGFILNLAIFSFILFVNNRYAGQNAVRIAETYTNDNLLHVLSIISTMQEQVSACRDGKIWDQDALKKVFRDYLPEIIIEQRTADFVRVGELLPFLVLMDAFEIEFIHLKIQNKLKEVKHGNKKEE